MKIVYTLNFFHFFNSKVITMILMNFMSQACWSVSTSALQCSAVHCSVEQIPCPQEPLEISSCKLWDKASGVGVYDISMKNYRKPINRYFLNYRQLIDIEKWKFWNYRKIIDIGKCIKFGPINTSKAKVSKMKFQLNFTKKMQEKLPLLSLLPWREVLIQY